MRVSICQLKFFMVMRSVIGAVVLAVMAVSGPAWLQPTSLDAWENTGPIRTLWLETHAEDLLADEVLRRHVEASYDDAPWRPLVIGRPPSAAQAGAAGFGQAGSDADHPPPIWRLMPPERLIQNDGSLFPAPVVPIAIHGGQRDPPRRA